MKIHYFSHPECVRHDPGLFHPEKPQRLSNLNEFIHQSAVEEFLEFREAGLCELKNIGLTHTKSYIEEVSLAFRNGRKMLDHGDTFVNEGSFRAALRACGAGIDAVSALLEQKTRRAFCAVRPPGHHAEQNHAMGFCLFNNIAVTANYARKMNLAEKILIIDWDVHHGNGTQHSFESDPDIFYYSIHQFPLFPGSGRETETGTGTGKGFTQNRPIPPNLSESEHVKYFNSDIKNITDSFRPDLILISAGFDAHEEDPIGSMNLTDESFGVFTEIVMEAAEKYCDGRIISFLEGGYNLQALAHSVEKHLFKMKF